jgi:hypothetical protein
MRKSLLVGAAAALALVPTASATAAAKPTYAPPVVNNVIPVVVADPTGAASAVVRASYTCYGGSSAHLYIGVKQGPQINATDHTSSQYADTFFSTNWNSDGPGLTLTCDGKQHTQGFVVQPDPYWAGAADAAPLHAGQVFVQFCVFDFTNSGEEGDENGFGFDYSMKKVVLGD